MFEANGTVLAFDPDRFESDLGSEGYEQGRSTVDGDGADATGVVFGIEEDVVGGVDGRASLCMGLGAWPGLRRVFRMLILAEFCRVATATRFQASQSAAGKPLEQLSATVLTRKLH